MQQENFKKIMHDIQSPLAALKLTIELLENPKTGSLDKEQKELIMLMKSSLEKLISIVKG